MSQLLSSLAVKAGPVTNRALNGFPGVSWFPQVQALRWRRRKHVRKPIWLGTAKTKLLRFPKWHPYESGELDELKKLHNDYKHLMRSLICYFKEEYAKVSETSVLAAEKQKEEEEEHARLMEENRLENERVAAIRNERLAAEVKARQEKLLQSFARQEEIEREEIQEAEAVVRQKKEMALMMITMDSLDDAIETAMDKEVDYNFAIDLDGNVYRGRHQTKASGEKLEAVTESLVNVKIS